MSTFQTAQSLFESFFPSHHLTCQGFLLACMQQALKMSKLELQCGKHGLKEVDVEPRNFCQLVLLSKAIKAIRSQDLS